MITIIITKIKSQINKYYNGLSLKTKKETTRFIVAFSIAWLVKTLLNEIPYFTQLIYISNLDQLVLDSLINLTKTILENLGYKVYTEGKFIQIIGTYGIRYELGCLAFRHFTLFIVFIMVYYGRWINKIWYIPTGIILIMLINAIRGSIICIAQLKFPDKYETVHDLLSPWLMYSTILILWIVWTNYFGQYLASKKLNKYERK